METTLARVRALLESGASVNTSDQAGRTLLFVSARDNELDLATTLLDRGANANQAKTDGYTPLSTAAREGHLPMVQLLLDRGAGVNQADNDGYTPLYIAAQEGHLDVVQLLLDHEADVNQAENDGYTPLYIAAQEGHLPVVKLLLDRGADVNLANTNGDTPLCIAAYNGYLCVVKLLLDCGAGENQAKTDGDTPLSIAAQEGHLDVVQLLLEHAADLAVNDGAARRRATSRGHAAVAQLLAASEEARALAQQGNAEPFRAQIEAAELGSPLAQWVPALPAAARTVLVTWARAAVQDAGVCYAVFYADLVLPPPPDALVHEWRGLVGHDGVVGLRRLIVSFLVHPKAGTRRALWELAAMGDLGASAGVEAVPVEAVVAAARSAAVVRARWAFVQEPDEASTRYSITILYILTN